MKKNIIVSVKVFGVMLLLLGVLYPLTVTGVAQLLFKSKANGSLVQVDGRTIGSSLIGEQFTGDNYFHSRPSHTNYNTLPSGASNLGLTSAALHEIVAERKAELMRYNSSDMIPAEMVFASASGLDPHISPEAARMQVERISQARGFSQAQMGELYNLVERMAQRPQLGFMGCGVVNVLLLNVELDKMK